MLTLIVLLPLLGFLNASIFGRFLGKGACYITTFNTFISFCLSCVMGFDAISKGLTYKIILSPWIYSDMLKVNWAFQFDSLTFVMLFVITFISTLVHLYSMEYMESDPHLIRFMSYLSLFTFFMLILVTADNFLQMFVGWEGVGLSSFLLINFWYTRIQANKAAIKAMLVNRVGDFAILFALFLIYYVFNSLDYDIVFSLCSSVNTDYFSFFGLKLNYIDFITFLLFLGAMGKSAQFGLHTWLPDAMEGPTPVSALIHAATMVTAGVFLIVRCSYLFELSSFSLNVILIVGSLTTFFSSTVGLFQNDLKKIIAYSTCSQLGYMVFACGLSSYDVAVFHLSNHAFFKALLFLAAGSVIHAINDEQDLRLFGGLKLKLPLSYAVMTIGSLALMGFPFLSGFYSKDVILELAYSKHTTFGHFAYCLGTLSVFSTAFYSVRLLYLVFLSEPNGSRQALLASKEPGLKMLLSLCILAFFSIFVGFFSRELFIGFGASFWESSIFVLPSNNLIIDVEFLPLFPKLLPLFLSFFGAMCAYFLYCFFIRNFYIIKNNIYFKQLYNFLNRRWYFDRVYNQFLSQPIINNGFSFFYKDIDRGVLEQFGPFGVVQLLNQISKRAKFYQNGSIFHYLFIFLFLTFLSLFILIFFSYFILIIEQFFLFFLFSFFFDLTEKSVNK
jgi:proton-translocating NADH-quinone oxidoreductase chain L